MKARTLIAVETPEPMNHNYTGTTKMSTKYTLEHVQAMRQASEAAASIGEISKIERSLRKKDGRLARERALVLVNEVASKLAKDLADYEAERARRTARRVRQRLTRRLARVCDSKIEAQVSGLPFRYLHSLAMCDPFGHQKQVLERHLQQKIRDEGAGIFPLCAFAALDFSQVVERECIEHYRVLSMSETSDGVVEAWPTMAPSASEQEEAEARSANARFRVTIMWQAFARYLAAKFGEFISWVIFASPRDIPEAVAYYLFLGVMVASVKRVARRVRMTMVRYLVENVAMAFLMPFFFIGWSLFVGVLRQVSSLFVGRYASPTGVRDHRCRSPEDLRADHRRGKHTFVSVSYGIGRDGRPKGYTLYAGLKFPFPVTVGEEGFLAFLEALRECPRERRHEFLTTGKTECAELWAVYDSYYVQPPVRATPTIGNVRKESISALAYVAGLIKAVYEKDVLAGALLVASAPERANHLFSLCGCTDLEDLIRAFWDGADNDAELVVPTGPSVWDFRDCLPDKIKHAPIVLRVTALASALLLSNFTKENSYYKRLSKSIDLSSVAEKVFCAALVVQVVKAVWDGYNRFCESEDPLDFLGVNRDVQFVRDASVLLKRAALKPTREEHAALVIEIETLLESRGVSDVGEIAAIKSRLRDVILKERFFEEAEARERDAEFVRAARQLVFTKKPKASLREIEDDMVLARKLLEGRKGTDTGEVLRYKDRLLQYLDEKRVFVESTADRLEPMVIFTFGTPGTGKSTLTTAMANMLAVADGEERYPGDVCDWNVHDKFPAETVKNDHFRYVVFNDIPADYSEFPKQDKESIEITWQRIIDTVTLSIRAAAVERKGNVYSAVRYVIINSNFDSFLFTSDTGKLKRRFKSGVVCRHYYSVSGREVEPASVKEAERSACARFDKVEPKFDGMRMTVRAEPSVTYNLQQFLAAVVRHSKDHWAFVERQQFLFRNPSTCCACGVPYAMHRGDGGKMVKIFENCELGGLEIVTTSPTIGFMETVGIGATIYVLVSFIWPRLLEAWIEFLQLSKAQIVDVVTTSSLVVAERVPSLFRKMLRDECEAAIVLMKWRALRLWSKMKKFFKRYSYELSFLIGAMAAGAISWNHFRPTRADSSGPVLSRLTVDSSSMVTPVRETVQVVNPGALRSWARTDPIEHVVLATRGVSFADLSRMVINANVEMILRVRGVGSVTVYGLFLDAQNLMFNEHFLRWDAQGPTDVAVYPDEFSLEVGGKECAFRMSDVRNLRGEGEMVCVQNFWRSTTPNLRKFFLKEPTNQHVDIVVLRKTENCRTVASSGRFAFAGRVMSGYTWKVDNRKGECGTAVLGQIGNDWFILGLVSFGTHPKGEGIFQFQGLFPVVSTHFDAEVDLPMVDEVYMTGAPLQLGVLSPHSEWRANPSLFLEPLGTDVGSRGKTFVSKIKATRLYDYFSKKLSETYRWPTSLGGEIDGKHVSAWSHAVGAMNMPDLIPYGDFRDCMNAYLGRVTSELGRLQPNLKLAPLSLAEAFFGLQSSGIDGVPMATSVGPLWREAGYRNKRDLFVLSEDGSNYKLVEDFRAMVAKKIAELQEAKIHVPVCEFVPKDEVRPATKLDVFKVRLFSVVDFDYNIIMRMFLMPLITVLLQNPFISSIFGGMNAGSKTWTELVSFLNQVDGEYSDADYSSFDSRHWRLIFLCAEFFWKFALWCGYDKADADVVYFIMFSLATQIIMYQNDFYLKTKGLISGVIVTLIVNSLVNIWLLMMAFSKCTNRAPHEFFVHVRCAVVGDDNVSKISSEVIENFNMVKAQPIFEKAGYKVTPASKNGVFERGMSLGDLVFVKRSFVLGSDGYYRAPLNKDSIYKSFCFQFEDAKVSAPQRLHDVYASNVREAYMWGKEFFANFVQEVDAVYDEHKLPHPILTYEGLEVEFHNGSFKTFMCSGPARPQEPLGPRQQPPEDICTEGRPWSRSFAATMIFLVLYWIISSGCGGSLDLTLSPAQLNQNNDNFSAESLVGTNSILTDVAAPPVTARAMHFLDDKRDDYRDFVTHQALIHHIDWLTSSTGNVVICGDLMRHYLANLTPQLRNKWNNFSYCRGTIVLRVVVQGAAQMAGQMVVAAYPLPKMPLNTARNAFYFATSVNDRIVPHLVVDPSKSETLELRLPIITQTGWYDLINQDLGSYYLRYNFLTPLFSGTAAAVPVRVCFYVNVEDVELVGRTIATGPAMKEQNRTEVVERDPTAWLGGMLRRGVGIFSRGIAVADGVLSALGFSKPQAMLENSTVLVRTCDNYSQKDGLSHAIVLGASQTQNVSIDPGIMGGDLSDMSVAKLIAIPGLVHQMTVTQAATAESLVSAWPVTPITKQGDASIHPPTPLFGVALAHTLWRGSISYTLEFVGSVFHRATFLVAYDPVGNPASPPTFDQAMTVLKNTTIYVSGNTSVEIEIPYMQPKPALEVWSETNPLRRRVNGAVFLYLVNPVITNGGTAPLHINLYHRSTNMALMMPDPLNIDNQPHYAVQTVPTGPEMGTALDDWVGKPQFASFGTTSVDQIDSDLTGDVSISIKDITSRMMSDRDLPSTSVGDNVYITAAFPSSGQAPAGPYDFSNNWITYFGRAFVGVRGSVRFSFGGIGQTAWTTYKPDGFRNTVANGFSTSATLASNLRAYAMTTTNCRISANVDTVVPYVSPFLFRTLMWAGSAGSGAATAVHGIAGLLRVFVYTGFPPTEGMEVFWGTGDDFVFSNFVGFPSYNGTLAPAAALESEPKSDSNFSSLDPPELVRSTATPFQNAISVS